MNFGYVSQDKCYVGITYMYTYRVQLLFLYRVQIWSGTT